MSQYFWPENFRINELVAELSGRGHDITVLTGKPNYPAGRIFTDFARHPSNYAAFKGARIVRVPMLSRGTGTARLVLNYLTYALSATVFGIFRLGRQRYDAIFVFGPSPITVCLPAIALGRVYRCGVAFWVLDQWPETLAAVGAVKSSVVLRLVRHLVSFIYARCQLLLAPSKSMVAEIRKFGIDESRIVYFPNWPESEYAARAAVPAPEVPSGNGAFTVLFAGNIGESQGFPAILTAADQLRDNSDIRWLILGDGRVAEWVRAEVARRGLQDRVFLLGRHPLERMPSFFCHASALLVSLNPDPSFAVTIPGKLPSYLAFGLPVIGMMDGEGAVIIDEAQAGLACAAGDGKKLAEIVLRMAAMPDSVRSAMGSSGRAYASREFDRDMLMTRLERLLEKLALGHSGGRQK